MALPVYTTEKDRPRRRKRRRIGELSRETHDYKQRMTTERRIALELKVKGI